MQELPYDSANTKNNGFVRAVAGEFINGMLFNYVYWHPAWPIDKLVSHAEADGASHYIILPDDGKGRKILAVITN